MIVSDNWLDACGKAGYFLPAKSFLVKDKAAERQHGFSLEKYGGRGGGGGGRMGGRGGDGWWRGGCACEQKICTRRLLVGSYFSAYD